MKGEDGPDVDRELFALVNRGSGPEADRAFAGITELGSLYASGAAAGVLLATGRAPSGRSAPSAPPAPPGSCCRASSASSDARGRPTPTPRGPGS